MIRSKQDRAPVMCAACFLQKGCSEGLTGLADGLVFIPAMLLKAPKDCQRLGCGFAALRRGENASGQPPLPSPLLLRASGGEGVNCRPLPTKNFVPRPSDSVIG